MFEVDFIPPNFNGLWCLAAISLLCLPAGILYMISAIRCPKCGGAAGFVTAPARGQVPHGPGAWRYVLSRRRINLNATT